MTCLFQVSLLCAPDLLVAHLSTTRLSRHFGALRLRRQLGPGCVPLPDWRSRRRSRSVTPRMICTCPDCLPVVMGGTFDRGPGFAFAPPFGSSVRKLDERACPLARCHSPSPIASNALSLPAIPHRTMPYSISCHAMQMRALRFCVAGRPSRPLACMVSLACASRLQLSRRIGPRLKMSWLISAHRRLNRPDLR